MTSVVIGTAGHIDHGKSALVKALTGTDPDRLKEEKARGITIDLGFAHLATPAATLAFVDVPGHERFVRTMLAGAGGIDAVLFVVAADESVMPQTREHFDICRLLGIDRGVIALTKSDLVDRDTIDLVTLEVRDLVAGSFLADAPVVPVSARTGAGLADLTSALGALSGGPARLARRGVMRLPIDRAFTMKGFGTVVTGTIVSGSVAEGDELAALPAGTVVRVRGVQTHGRQTREASAPGRVAVNLGHVALEEVARGVTLATPETLSVTRRVDVDLELLPGAKPLKHGARVRVHHGTSEVLGRVSVGATRRAPGEEWNAARPGDFNIAVPPGGRAFVRLRLERPAVLTRLDRVVLRAYSPPVTIGGGVVLDPEPAGTGVRKAGAVARFTQLADPAQAIGVLLRDAGGRGLDAAALVRRAGLDASSAQAVAEREVSEGRARAVGHRVFDRAVVAALETAIATTLADFHKTHPLESGMPREALRDRASAHAAPGLFDAVLEDLAARSLIRAADRVSSADFRPVVPAADAALREKIREILRGAGLTPPDVAALAEMTQTSAPNVQEIVQRLVREKQLVKLDTLVLHPDALDALKQDIRAGAKEGRVTVDVATFKERYGLTRKFAIPLLEWLDRERVTRRVGDQRRVIG